MARGDRERKLKRDAYITDFLLEKAEEVGVSEGIRKNRSVATTIGRETLFLEQLHEMLREAFKNKLPVPKALTKKSNGKTKRILNVIFSDTHYGSALDPREVGHKYGAVEESRRTAEICRQVADYKIDHRADTELYVHILGDIIQGQLHDMRDGLPLAEQFSAALKILVQAIRFFSSQFPKGVTVFCTPGNHGRNTARHKERATNQKWDSIEMMIYAGLKQATSNLPNVNVVLGYEPKYDFQVFDELGIGTHGDTVINPGYPGKNINVEGIKKQINDINNARVMKKKGEKEKPYRLVIMGHVHVGSMTHLPGGVIVLTNGCLIPPDAYANSIGIFDTACGQWMWESVPGHIVGDARFITVDYDTDKDDSLDQIIQPSNGL